MSDPGNKTDHVVQQDASDPDLGSVLTNVEMPAMPSTLEEVEAGDFDISMPDVENMVPPTELIDILDKNNDSNLKPLDESLELTEAEKEHFTSFEDIDSILDNVVDLAETRENKETNNSVPVTDALSDECAKQIDVGVKATSSPDNLNSTQADVNIMAEVDIGYSIKEVPKFDSDLKLSIPDEGNPTQKDTNLLPEENDESLTKATAKLEEDTVSNEKDELIEEDINPPPQEIVSTIKETPNSDDLSENIVEETLESLGKDIPKEDTAISSVHEKNFIAEESIESPVKEIPTGEIVEVTIEKENYLADESIESPTKEVRKSETEDVCTTQKETSGTDEITEEKTPENTVDTSVIDDTQNSNIETKDVQTFSGESPIDTEGVETALTDKQDTAIKEDNPSKSTTMETDEVSIENLGNEATAEESVENMETCDSQESINLVIDEEASNITEVKDDVSLGNKIHEESIMDVDTDEIEDNINNKNAENLDSETAKSPEAVKDNVDEAAESPKIINSDNEKESEIILEKPEDILSKCKDDDVIPIEQPPVPIIEIDDEEEIETINVEKETQGKEDENVKSIKKNLEECAASSEVKRNIAEVGIDDKEVNPTKENENKDMDENMLLVKSAKILIDEDIIPVGTVPATSDDAEETNDEVFYKKECINYECLQKHKQYFKVPQFAFSYFKVTKKKFKCQYICADCYDTALEMYEDFCGLINAKQPLLLEHIPSGRQEFVEIIDSSDDEDSSHRKTKLLEPTKTAFSKRDLALIDSELNKTVRSVLTRVGIQNQLTWSKTILTERLKRLEMATEYVDNELKALQKQADKMHEGLYTCPKIKIRQLQPLDLNSGKLMNFDSVIQKEVQSIPPVGEIERPPIQISNIYFAVKNNPIASWVPCKVMEQVDGSLSSQMAYNVKQYKIKFIRNQTQIPKTVPAKYLAYYEPPSVRLPIGTRVIAYFDATSLARGREKINVQSAFYPGIIAEPLKPNNKFRYLIFYDDGYTQYVFHKDVRLVCHVSDCVWEDVHPASRDFIQKYLTQYSINRPMVQTQKGQSMNTESNGYWLHARVVDIDCSLVLMQFEGSKSHTEWIYRGSLRLGPVFKEYQKSLQKISALPVSRLSRRTEPFIRYTEDEENTSQPQQPDKSADGNRAVARKTFGRPESMMNTGQSTTSQQQHQQPAVKHLNNSTIYVEDENKPKGKVVYYTAKRNLPPRKYKPHKCTPACQFEITHNLSAYSPLSKPLLSGWERFIIRQKIKRVVTYRAPCGKIIRNMKELHHYLRATNNVLNVDNFDFSHEISCLAEYVIESAIIQKRDISGGQEKMPIPLVNYYDNTLPPECKYSAKVIPTEGVNITTDPAFLVGCDCEDDCADKTKCACWQLTLAGAKYGNPNAAPEEVGYQYRRLLDHVPTGIYECNANCKCKSSCLNRVVQNSLTMKLQVFKTSNRGWGLRCINDIPRGSFVCVYAGHLLTEAKANEGGQDAGDEYFAELDYIEVAEQIKEGYESDVELPEAEEEDTYHPDVDDDFTPSKSFLTRAKQKQNAIKSTRSSNQEEDSQERQVINFNPNADMNEDSGRENSIRKLYGKDEACYVMDAKISGNLGRYFNHSCAPNMFVQNVFVNTHDLRFPNVAFFSSCNIRAGTELTWNYNYEVGVVPGKVLYCQCGASNCRLRLL